MLEELLDEKRSEWPRVLLRWLPFTALAVAACCLTPYGPDPLLMPLTTLGAGDALGWIAEWRPQDFGHFGAFEFLLLAGIFALSRGVTLPVVRALVVLGLIHFALAQVRNADLLAMLAPLYLAAPLARQFGARAEDDAAGSARGVNLAALSVMIVATGLALARDVRPALHNTPEAAVANAGLAKAGPVLNDYSFGGYLIFAGIPTSLTAAPNCTAVNSSSATIAICRWPICAIFPNCSISTIRRDAARAEYAGGALLDRLPDWQRVYSDDVAVVHKRRDAPKK